MWVYLLKNFKFIAQFLVFVAFFVYGAAVSSAPCFADPAVDGVNAKLGAEGGSYNDEGEVLFLGSVTTPIGDLYGLQIDGVVGDRNNETLVGGGAHFFHRDPARYLIGVYGSGHHLDPVTVWRAAAEIELYLDRVSVEGLFGYESVEVPSSLGNLNVLTRDDEHFFTAISLGYYITDDFRVTGGYRYANQTSFAVIEAEYAFSSMSRNYSVFAKGQFGDDQGGQFDRVVGGIRIYFGGNSDKSLMRRHREDDPKNWVPEFTELAVAPPPPPPTPPPPAPPPDDDD